jgi:phosphatidylinositol glycan class B
MAAAAPWHVFSLLLSLRIVNSLVVRTFFQPDEYFQSLEPAWRLAFGDDSGAWITWVYCIPANACKSWSPVANSLSQEWRNGLRSSLHPLMFACVYRAASTLSDSCSFSASTRSALLLATPKVAQAVFAACIDYFTWSLARKLNGPHSRVAWTTVCMSSNAVKIPRVLI